MDAYTPPHTITREEYMRRMNTATRPLDGGEIVRRQVPMAFDGRIIATPNGTTKNGKRKK